MRRAAAAATVVVLSALSATGSAVAGDGGSPYFGTDYDCSPIMTDSQALRVTGTNKGVVESVRFTGPRNYTCQWSNASRGKGVTLVIGVSDLQDRAGRKGLEKAMCSDDLPLPDDKRKLVCDAAEDMVGVRTAASAFEAYARLTRAAGGGGTKMRIDLGDGVRGYWIGGLMGGAVTMVTPGWSVIHAACLWNVKAINRDCSVEALRIALRNMRAAVADFCDGEQGSLKSCRAPLPTPVPKSGGKPRR